MLGNSMLGKFYTYWEGSFIFGLLAAVVHTFANAWKYSLIRRLLLHKSRLQELYEQGMISRVVDGTLNLILKLLSAICRFFKPAWENSRTSFLISGSIALKYEFMLGAWICFMFIVPHDMWSNLYAVMASLGLLGLYALLAASGRRSILYPKHLSLPFAIFVAITLISILYTADRRDSFRNMLFFMAAFIFMWLAASEFTAPQKLMRLFGWIYIVLIFTALYAIGQRLTGLEVNPTFIDAELNPNIPARVYSTVENPNNYAELLVLFMPFGAVYAMNRKKAWQRFLLTCGMVFPAGAMLMTYSRAGWLSIALTAFIFVYYTNRKLIPWIFVAAFLCLPFLPASIMTRLANLLNTSDKSASFRLKLWGYCLELLSMENRWLTGIGLGSITLKHQLGLVSPKAIGEGMAHTQMLYMELFMEWGIFGFLSFMWFIIGRIKNGAIAIYRTCDKVVKGGLIAAVSALSGMAIMAFFEYIWFYPRILHAFFIVVGILIGCTRAAGELNGS